MRSRSLSGLTILVCLALLLAPVTGSQAAPVLNPTSTAYQPLPFVQDWSDINLISINDDWSNVPGITGYHGNSLTTTTGIDPQTVTAAGTSVLKVHANQSNPDTFTSGGVAEFHTVNPVIAIKGSETADAPFILLHLNTTGFSMIQILYQLRDMDGSANNAVQPVALQYRIGDTGPFTNVPQGFVADASTGPYRADKITLVMAFLPPEVNNQPQVQLRIITTNALGNDEWIGVENLVVVANSGDAELAPFVTSGSPMMGDMRVFPDANLTVAFSEPVDVTAPWFSITCSVSGDHPAAVSGGPQFFTLNPETNFVYDEVCNVTLFAAGIEDQDSIDPPGNPQADADWSFATLSSSDPDACDAPLTPIYIIQGSTSASSLVLTEVSTQGIVSGDFQAADQLKGFFMQDAVGDGDPATSDGIFVYTPIGFEVNPGDRVRVKGGVAEVSGLTLISPESVLTVCETGQSLSPAILDPPFTGPEFLEAYEGMLVTIPETLTVSEHYNLGRYGEVTVSAGGRLFQPTSDQGSSQGVNDRSRLLLDDGSHTQNPSVVPFLGAGDTLRLGDTTTGLTGVIDFAFSQYRLQPTIWPTFLRANPRPGAPEDTGGSLEVASFNVLNYFNGDGRGGGFPTSRGANNLDEFQRQRAKIIAALVALDADVVGLIEIENDGAGEFSALADLVNGLNAATSPGAYALIEEPAPGSDEIKVSLIYKPAVVTPLGAAQNYQAASDPYGELFDRPPLAQTFTENGSGAVFSVVVNHFKSKSCPGAGLDDDQGDGQGCWNAKRTLQAQELLKFVESLIEVDPDVLVIGDLNAYAQEDPLDALLSGDLANIMAEFVPLPSRYTYAFEGQSGSLDHALATSELASQVSGATIWHINADEPRSLDYNTEFNPASLYHPDAYRSSDHDPVLIGLQLSQTRFPVYLPWMGR